MLALKEYFLLARDTPEIYPKANLFRRSVWRTFVLDYLPQKQYQRNRDREASFQMECLAELANNSPKFRTLHMKITDFAINNGKSKASEAKKYEDLYEERLKIYADFFKISAVDRRRFNKIAERYTRMKEKKVAQQTKKGWKIGLGIVAGITAFGAAAVYYSHSQKDNK